MTDCAELDIWLTPQADGACRVDMRFSPDGDTVQQLDRPATARFDLTALLEVQPRPDDYGRALTASLFADEAARTLFGSARFGAETAGRPLRLRLNIPYDAGDLHGLLWETLRDPQRDRPLLTDEHLRFSRLLASENAQPAQIGPRRDLSALLAVAAPDDLADYNLAPIDTAGELARAGAALGDIPAVELAGRGAATLDGLLDAIRSRRPDIVYLVAHGRLARNGAPMLLLEGVDGKAAPVSGRDLAGRVAVMQHRPRLMVLASCQSAGAGDSGDPWALAATGPLLARAGVPAVLAMHGAVSIETAGLFTQRFLRELAADGEIDRAMAVARAAVRNRPDWWAPVLFMRLRSGRLWREAGAPAAGWQFEIALELAGDDALLARATWNGAPAGSEQVAGAGERLAALRGRFVGRDGQNERALAELGRSLGRLVFPAAVADGLLKALEEARAAGHPLALRFQCGDDELLALPLEAARLPDGRATALLPAVHVSRSPLGVESAPDPPLPGPLRILAAVAAPDEDQTPSTPLDRERELQVLMDVVELAGRGDGAQVTVLEVAHPHQIRDALLAHRYHVLHLSGHGARGWVEMETEDGGAVAVFPDDLADALQAGGCTVPLVFLSTCHGAASGEGVASFAAGLLRRGVPQVVAMQRAVTDGYATRLAGQFYARLGEMAEPRAGHALALARAAAEKERLAALGRGELPALHPPESATAALFSAGDERPLLDRTLPPDPLPPRPEIPYVRGMPVLATGDLIGRRPQMRLLMHALRGDRPATDDRGRTGPWRGALIHGMGGSGKSALAGRVMQRLAEAGWTVAAVVGRWGLGELAAAVGAQLAVAGDEAVQRLGALLGQPGQSDEVRLHALGQLLSRPRFLLVLDNFEDNLALGGGRFADETAALLLDELLAAAGRGKLLITSRYPLPEGAGGDGLAAVHLPPLSPAETRRFFHRLEGLATTGAGDTQAVLRRIGGHPRTLEYLDALLRRAPARLAHANRSLRAELRRRGLALEAMGGDLDSALRDAAQLAAGNILLDELLAEAGKTPGDLEVFMQAAVYPAPVETEGLAWGRAVDGPPDRKALAAAQDACDRLAKLSLLTPAGNGRWFVHRWTAESLPRDEDAHRAHCRRAGEYHLWRMATASHDLNDAVEAVRLLLAAEAWDRAAGVAWQIVPVLRDYGQTVALTSFLNEVVSALPESHEGFPGLSVTFGDALLTLGFASAALEHYDKGRLLFERLAAAEPDRADYQRDLSVSFNKMGDLFTALGQGEQARLAYQRSLEIAERLAAAEPDRADYQRDLSVSFNKMGDLFRALGQGEQARLAYQRSLEIAERLAAAEPDRADYQRDLSVSYERMGDLFTALGQGEQARLAYQRSLEIAERLAAAEPDRADYQRDLSVSFNKMGDLFTALGQGEQARLAFQQALEIRERLAAAEPDRADAAWDLVVSLWRMATLDEAAGRQYFERALAIMQPLHAAGRLFPEQVEWMRRLEEMLGEGEGGV